MQDAKTVRVQQFIKATPQRVFKALTEKEELEKWFVQGAVVDLKPGGEVQSNWAPGMGEHGFVQEVEAPRLFSFTWEGQFSPTPTTLRFELLPENDGTMLTLIHTGIGEGKGWEAYATMDKAWPAHLGDLKSWVETGACPPPGPRG